MGDGNLSFSASLSQRFSNLKVIGSVIEKEEDFFMRYPRGKRPVEILRSLRPRCDVRFGLDATRIPKEFGDVDVFIMNFPHVGGKTNIRRARNLLKGVFASLKDVMKTTSFFNLSLTNLQCGLCLARQDGKYELWSDSLPHQLSDSWIPMEIGASEGFFLQYICNFCDIDGYEASGYLNRDQFFHNHDSVILQFVKKDLPGNLAEAVKLEESSNKPSVYSTFRPYFNYHLSVLFHENEDVTSKERLMKEFVCDTLGNLLCGFEEVNALRTRYNSRPNRIYNLVYQSNTFPLFKQLCNKFQNELEFALQQQLDSIWGH